MPTVASPLALPTCLLFSYPTSPPPPRHKHTQRRAQLLSEYYRQYAAIEELKGMEFYKAMDKDPKTAIFMSVFDSMGRLYEAGNAVFEKTFMPIKEYLESAGQNKTIKLLLSAAVMAPEDRVLWFRTAFEVAITPTTRSVHFIKVGSSSGWVGMCTSLPAVRVVSSLLTPPPPPPPPPPPNTHKRNSWLIARGRSAFTLWKIDWP